MKYTVSVGDECYAPMCLKSAIRIARIQADTNPEKAVFVSWYRPSDGQAGYVNRNGDHVIIGDAW